MFDTITKVGKGLRLAIYCNKALPPVPGLPACTAQAIGCGAAGFGWYVLVIKGETCQRVVGTHGPFEVATVYKVYTAIKATVTSACGFSWPHGDRLTPAAEFAIERAEEEGKAA